MPNVRVNAVGALGHDSGPARPPTRVQRLVTWAGSCRYQSNSRSLPFLTLKRSTKWLPSDKQYTFDERLVPDAEIVAKDRSRPRVERTSPWFMVGLSNFNFPVTAAASGGAVAAPALTERRSCSAFSEYALGPPLESWQLYAGASSRARTVNTTGREMFLIIRSSTRCGICSTLKPSNDTIQPAAAKTACQQDRPDPPLGCNRWLSGRFAAAGPAPFREHSIPACRHRELFHLPYGL
jgi:hypothetical protein